MNSDQIEGKWEELKGKIQRQWGKLTSDDFNVIEGDRKQLAGRSGAHRATGAMQLARRSGGHRGAQGRGLAQISVAQSRVWRMSRTLAMKAAA